MIARYTLVALAAVAAFAAVARADDVPTVTVEDLTAPASQPAETQAATAPSEARHPNISDSAIEMRHSTYVALTDVRDDARSLDEAARYLLIGEAHRIEPLGERAFDALYEPSYEALMRNPKRYRGQAVRIEILPQAARKMIPGEDPDLPAFYLPEKRPVWRILAVMLRNGQAVTDEWAVVLYSTVDPATFLQAPSGRSSEGYDIYPPRAIQVGAIFYKLYRAKSIGSAENPSVERTYPVLIVFQAGPARDITAKKDWTAALGVGQIILVLMIFMLGGGWIILRRRMRRSIRSAPIRSGSYRPLRDLAADSDDQSPPAEQASTSDEVDPDLRAAAEAYLKRKESGDNDANRSA